MTANVMTDAGSIATQPNFSEDNLTHGYTQVGEVRLHHVSAGEGPPVLLIPGWPQTWYAWRYMIPALAAAGFHAIAVDPRGIGQSGRPMSGYDTGQVAADLHSLMCALGYERYSVVGHDIGVWIGYALASDYPQAVERLAIMEAHVPGLAATPGIFLPPAKNRSRWHFMFNQLPDLPEMLIQGREQAYLSWMFEQWSYRREAVAVDTYIKAYSVPGALRAGFSYYRAIPETIVQNAQRAERKLAMPVLALGGEHAASDAPRVMMEPVTVDLRSAILPGGGHFVPEECPDALLEHLVPFLRGER